MRSKIFMAVVPVLGVLGHATSAEAALYWDNTGTATWNTVGSWSSDPNAATPDPASYPTAGDDAVFNISSLNSNVTIGMGGLHHEVKSLTFNSTGTVNIGSGGGNRDLTVGTGGVTLAAGAGNVTVGNSGAGSNVFFRVGSSQTWSNNSTGSFTSRNSTSGPTSGTTPVTLTMSANSSGSISNSGALSDGAAGAVVSLVVDSAGTGNVSMSGGGFSGGTTLKRGLLTTNQTLGTGSIIVGDTSGGDARLQLTNIATNAITIESGTGLRALTGNTNADYQGNITLNRDVNLGSVSTSSQTVLFSGNISGNASITVGRVATGSSSPVVVLSGSNTYTGKTTVESATLVVSSINSVASGSSSSSLGAPTTVANGTISLGAVASSTLRYVGPGETTDRVIDLAGATNGGTLEQAGTGLLKFTSNLTTTGNGNKTLTLRGATVGTGEIAGSIANSTGSTAVTKTDAGTWRLSSASSTYTGITTVSGGVLEVTKLSDINTPSSLGAPTATTGQTVLNGGGVLRYVGSGDSTNRVLTLGSTGGSLDASGSGAVVFSNTSTSAFGSSNVAVSFGLTGTSTVDNTYAANQKNNGTGAFSLTKSGTGTWVLSGASTYTGTTTVDGGLLKITGSLGNTAVAVNDTGTLGGSGTIAGSVTVNAGGTLAPGNSPGILSTGDLTLAGDSMLSVELNGTTVGSTYDQANVTGTVSIAGDLSAALGYAPTLGDNLFIINNDGADAVSGGFANLGVGDTIDLVYSSSTYRFVVSYVGDFGTNSATGGNDVVLTNVLVPEPASLAFIALSAVGLMRRRRVA